MGGRETASAGRRFSSLNSEVVSLCSVGPQRGLRVVSGNVGLELCLNIVGVLFLLLFLLL